MVVIPNQEYLAWVVTIGMIMLRLYFGELNYYFHGLISQFWNANFYPCYNLGKLCVLSSSCIHVTPDKF